MSNPTEKALQLLRYLPRLSLQNLLKSPYAKKKSKPGVGQYRKRLPINKSNIERRRYTPVGYSLDYPTPFYMSIPIERYYKNHKHRRQYPPLSLYQLQLLIDTGIINPEEPIDLTTLCLSNHYHIDPFLNHFGVNLTDDGINEFKAKVNIEVQYVKEPVIAAIERNGGVITSAYYDIKSVIALKNPLEFFKRGMPIPKRLLPPEDALEYYTDPKNRGYLADPIKVEHERRVLAQKYAYKLHEKDNMSKILNLRKDPRQIFFGLDPGMVINLKDKEILMPTDEMLLKYYKS